MIVVAVVVGYIREPKLVEFELLAVPISSLSIRLSAYPSILQFISLTKPSRLPYFCLNALDEAELSRCEFASEAGRLALAQAAFGAADAKAHLWLSLPH